MSDQLFGILFLGFIFLGLPAIFFLAPYFYVKLMDKIETIPDSGLSKRTQFLLSKRVRYLLLTMAIVLFVSSIIFVAKADYSKVDSVYWNMLMSDLMRNSALVVFGGWAGVNIIRALKIKTDLPEMTSMVLLVFIGCIVYLSYSLNTTVKELNVKVPSEIQGRIIEKREVHFGKNKSEVEYHIRVTGQEEDFIMRGNNSENGFEAIQEGDFARVWYGKYSRDAYLVKRLSK